MATAASIFQKLLRNRSQPSTTPKLIVSHLTTTTTTTTTTTHHPSIIPPPTEPQFLAQPSGDSNLSNPTHYSEFYPSFSFGYFLNPASSAGFIVPDDPNRVVPIEGEEDPKTMWADSVKKKRKRKMNKHKLKKLRKSLRKKT